jgi:hypothetical protein
MASTLTISGEAGEPIQMSAHGISIDTITSGNWITGSDTWQLCDSGGYQNVNIHAAGIGFPMQGKEVKDMRSLYHVVVVNYKTDEILDDGLVIAENAEKARIRAAAPFVNWYDLDDLDVICNKLGDVRKKKEVQKVQVVKE